MAEALPHRKTYGGSYVRIVDPGRHVFKSKLGFGRCFYSLAGLGMAAACVWLRAVAARETSHDVFNSIFQWLCAGGAVVGIVIAMLLALASQVVEITPRQILLRRKLFFVWKEKRFPVSSFLAATAEGTWAFHIGGKTPLFTARLTFETGYTFDMNFTFTSTDEVAALVVDINRSVVQAFEAPQTF